MLKTSIYLSILLLLALSACKSGEKQQEAQSKETTGESADSSATAKIEFATDLIDFGDIAQGEIVTRTLKFKNTGKKALLIKQVETSCGCLTASCEPKPIPPGKEGILNVTFDSEGIYGKQYKIITIFANIPEKATEVRVLANIKY